MRPIPVTPIAAALCCLAAVPALAQQAGGGPPWQSPGEPLAAAQTTREYVPNRDVVRAVQQRLNQLGYSTPVDGHYTAALRNNVMRFQSETGLRPTGEVDMSTIGALGINVQPVGVAPVAASAPPPPPPPAAQQTQVRRPGRDQIFERDEAMSSPQSRHQAAALENSLGLTFDPDEVQVGELPPGFPPGYPVENLGLN